jgi:hypothetical protein
MVGAGMKQCHCTQNVNHLTHPSYDNDLPAHFSNGWDYVFLATADMVFDTVPLSDDHPNPLDLSFVTRRVALKVQGQYAHPTSCEEPIPSEEEVLQHYNVRFLDPRSLAILHTFLLKNQKEEKITRLGIGMTWRAVLNLVSADMDHNGDLIPTIKDEEIRHYYIRYRPWDKRKYDN